MKAFQKLVFVIYLILLFWGILFKFSLIPTMPMAYRSINFVPYAELARTLDGQSIDWREILFNIVAFIPLGYYLNRLKLVKAIAILTGMSVFLELVQFGLAIGMADITDVIHNLIGGVIGYMLCIVIFRRVKHSTDK